MKYPFIFSLTCFLSFHCVAQTGEFGELNNGLIYPDTTMQQLKFIVDSLNLKFKICDLTRIYQSKPQAKANFISLIKDSVQAAKKDIEANITFDDFMKKYNKAEIEKNLLVVKYLYKNYADKDVLEFESVELNNDYGHSISFENNIDQYTGTMHGKWVYRYDEKSEYGEESVKAFYFTEPLTQQPIPETYARMIQYSDCMVDTSTQIFYADAKKSYRFAEEKIYKTQSFLNYAHEATRMPEYNERKYSGKKYNNYLEQYHLWDSLKFIRMDSLQAHDTNFTTLLNEALEEALANGGSSDEFEEYIERYYSKKTALQLKRGRIVVGSCSQDNSPRLHALNIAMLSAATVNWEIFLRSHLDIMNDRFQRVSDGSYAWARRNTYIKELEMLDIDVLNLLLGISLRIENPSTNHYYGSIGRIGRALAETNQKEVIEAKMLQIISDAQLDDFNRVLIYYLFLNYNYYLEDKGNQTANQSKLAEAVNTLPAYLATKITVTP